MPLLVNATRKSIFNTPSNMYTFRTIKNNETHDISFFFWKMLFTIKKTRTRMIDRKNCKKILYFLKRNVKQYENVNDINLSPQDSGYSAIPEIFFCCFLNSLDFEKLVRSVLSQYNKLVQIIFKRNYKAFDVPTFLF